MYRKWLEIGGTRKGLLDVGPEVKDIRFKDYQKVHRLVKPVQAEYDNIICTRGMI